MSAMIRSLLVAKLLTLLFVYSSASLLHEINPRKNLWVTWADESGVSEFCLAMASATDPFQTCLIGIPGYNENSFKTFSTNKCSESKNVADCSAKLISGLNKMLPWDPQELNLMASQAIGNSSQNWTQTCIVFGSKYAAWPYPADSPDVSPKDRAYYFGGEYCGMNDMAEKVTAFGAYGVTHRPGSVPFLWNNNSAKALPPDVFLICGDRAWQGIPKDIVGGPCYLGSLTIFAPKFSELRNFSHILCSRFKRSIGLTPGCNDNVQLLSRAARVALSVFIPGAAAGNALRTVAQLACWAEKQANTTTAVLEELLMDQNSMRHSLLQNRAAIDFLLLAQGHGCEDFEGMCCMNLSDHSESIHRQLTYLREHSQKIQQDINPLDDWLHNIFSGWGIGARIRSWMIIALKILGIVLLVFLACTIVLAIMKRFVNRVLAQVWIAQKQEEGIVEAFLTESGFVSNPAFGLAPTVQ